ncbi:MAG: hypothetical protein IT195_10635 [Microthrixaceae bacterium]|nr:hypothetical protein [Microthrixaceae bacterium]
MFPAKPRRRVASLFLLLTVVLIGTGCQTVKAGSRCRPGKGFAKDETHVLSCKGGRWTPMVTFGQAAQILLGPPPAHIENFVEREQAPVAAGSDSTVTSVVRVLRSNLAPARGTTVRFEFPTTPGAPTPTTAVETVTDADGRARISWRPGTVAGQFVVSAEVDGLAPLTVLANVLAAEPHSLEIVGGNNQIGQAGWKFRSRFEARVQDRFGNPVGGVWPLLAFDESLLWIDEESVHESEHTGVMFFEASARAPGADVIAIGVELASGEFLVDYFDYSIV